MKTTKQEREEIADDAAHQAEVDDINGLPTSAFALREVADAIRSALARSRGAAEPGEGK